MQGSWTHQGGKEPFPYPVPTEDTHSIPLRGPPCSCLSGVMGVAVTDMFSDLLALLTSWFDIVSHSWTIDEGAQGATRFRARTLCREPRCVGSSTKREHLVLLDWQEHTGDL